MDIIQLKRGKLAKWTELNPVLNAGEIGLIYSDQSYTAVGFKIGDGVTPFNQLPTFGQSGSIETYTKEEIDNMFTAVDSQLSVMSTSILNFMSLISPAATAENKVLARSEVIDLIAENAGRLISADAAGNAFQTKAALLAGPYYYNNEETSLVQYDQALVLSDETHDGQSVKYKYNGSTWVLESVSFIPTQSQLAALNSGITSQALQNILAALSTIPVKTSDLQNDGDGVSSFATEDYVDENGGKINKIKRNGTELPIDSIDKSVDIEVPTKTSDLQNDSGFITQNIVDEIESDLNEHISNLENPHNVTAQQVGADLSGTAATLVELHETDNSAHSALFNQKQQNITGRSNYNNYILTPPSSNGGQPGVLEKATFATAVSVSNEISRAQAAEQSLNDSKVDKVTGKGLSTNDLTNQLKLSYDNTVSKVSGIEAGAQVNDIEQIKLRGQTMPIVNKTVDLGDLALTSSVTDEYARATLAESELRDGKQNILSSGNNIKTIAGKSILGPGDLPFESTCQEDNDNAPSTTAVRNFVNSSLNSAVAFAITADAAGNPFENNSSLRSSTQVYYSGQVYVPSRNDYCTVQADEAHPIYAEELRSIWSSWTTKQQYLGYYITVNTIYTLVTQDNINVLVIIPGETIPYTKTLPSTRYTYQYSGDTKPSYNASNWQFSQIVNGQGFTAAQIAAINSGITTGKVNQIDVNATHISANTAAITSEVTRATAAEQANATVISNEVTRAQTAEDDLDNRLTSAESDISDLQNDIETKAEISYVDSGLEGKLDKLGAGTEEIAIVNPEGEIERGGTAISDLATIENVESEDFYYGKRVIYTNGENKSSVKIKLSDVGNSVLRDKTVYNIILPDGSQRQDIYLDAEKNEYTDIHIPYTKSNDTDLTPVYVHLSGPDEGDGIIKFQSSTLSLLAISNTSDHINGFSFNNCSVEISEKPTEYSFEGKAIEAVSSQVNIIGRNNNINGSVLTLKNSDVSIVSNVVGQTHEIRNAEDSTIYLHSGAKVKFVSSTGVSEQDLEFYSQTGVRVILCDDSNLTPADAISYTGSGPKPAIEVIDLRKPKYSSGIYTALILASGTSTIFNVDSVINWQQVTGSTEYFSQITYATHKCGYNSGLYIPKVKTYVRITGTNEFEEVYDSSKVNVSNGNITIYSNSNTTEYLVVIE